MAARAENPLTQVSSSRSQTLRSVLAYHQRVSGVVYKFLNGLLTSLSAISRRMATDKGGQQGPRSTRDGPTNQAPNQRYRQPERNDRDNNNGNSNSSNNNSNSGIGVAPSVPGFGFQFPGIPNGFQFPPGFVFPGTMPAQPPPPGAS